MLLLHSKEMAGSPWKSFPMMWMICSVIWFSHSMAIVAFVPRELYDSLITVACFSFSERLSIISYACYLLPARCAQHIRRYLAYSGLTRRFWGFSLRRSDLLHRRGQIWRGEPSVDSCTQNFTPSVQVGESAPKKLWT